MIRIGILTLFATVLIFAAGCSGSSTTPVIPSDQLSVSANSSTGHAMKHMWGIWDVEIDPLDKTVEITQVRGADFTANVITFMQPPVGSNSLLITVTDVSEWLSDGRIVIDVTLLHPFPGLDAYTGFDVYGVFVHEGGLDFPYGDNSVNVTDGIDNAVLENADGYTAWMSPELFPDDGTILTFTPGNLGNPGFPENGADVNGYKYFADSLASDENIAGFYSVETNFTMRGKFSPGASNSREYVLKFPIVDDAPLLKFQYAVVANWEPSDPTLSGDPDVLDVPDDFPLSANAKECFYVDITDNSTAWYVDDTSYGGAISLDLEIFDWDGLDGIGNIYISSENSLVPGGYSAFDPGVLTWSEGALNSSVTTVEISGVVPTGTENQDILIVVESADPTTYDQGFPSVFPDLPLANYFRHTVFVDGESALYPLAEASIEPYFDGFGPAGTTDDPLPTEWYLTLDASGSTGIIFEYLWEMNGDDLFDDASGMIVSAGFPDPGTHSIRLKITDSVGGESIFDLPGTYEVVEGTYVWAPYSGGTPDGSRDLPFPGIVGGLAVAGIDGYVLVRGDDGAGSQCVYTEDVTLSSSHDAARLQGYYGDYDTDEPPMQTGYVRVTGDGITVDGFEITGPSNSLYTIYSHRAKVGTENASDIVFRHFWIHDINTNCKAIMAASGGSLTVQNVLETTLNDYYQKNLSFYGNPVMTWKNCTLDRLGLNTHGIGFYCNASEAYMTNTIWTDCGSGTFVYLFAAGPLLDFTYSCTCDTPTPPDGGVYFESVTPGDGCITTDPTYVDPFSDHHLTTGSPAIDTGDPTILDYDGSASDMGCYGGPYGDWDFEN